MKKKLKELDRMISLFSELIDNYPNSENYKQSLVELQRERELLAATIGKKK
jgi:hypothetical protein